MCVFVRVRKIVSAGALECERVRARLNYRKGRKEKACVTPMVKREKHKNEKVGPKYFAEGDGKLRWKKERKKGKDREKERARERRYEYMEAREWVRERERESLPSVPRCSSLKSWCTQRTLF